MFVFGLPSSLRISARLLAFLLVASGCAATGPSVEAEESEEASYPGYETFDPSGYDASPPPPATKVEHDVPERLMVGRVDVEAPPPEQPEEDPEPTAERIEGYRIQVFSTADRSTAEQVQQEALDWWEQSGVPLPSVVAYRQPYYRVRVGAFVTAEEAEEALSRFRERYPEAFLVPDLVTVYR